MKKSSKKFAKYFSYQPNKDTNHGGVKLSFTLFATAPRAHRYGARRLIRARKRGNRKKSERQLSQPVEYRLVRLGCLGLLTFLVTLVTMSVLAPVQVTDATGEILAALQNTNGTISLATSANPVNLSVEASPSGVVRVAGDTVAVSSSDTGYQLYVSAVGEETGLVRDGTDGGSANDVIPTLVSGDSLVSISAPVQLQNNTWGFAATGVDLVETANFDESYDTGDNSNANGKFASIPSRGDDVLIARSDAISDATLTTLYYGVKATSAKPSGLYKNTIVYTAISNSAVSRLAAVTPERTTKVTGGEILTISTPSTLGLDSVGEISVTVGGEVCLHPEAAKSDEGEGAYVNVTCSAPALATGWHEVIVSFANETYVVNPGIEYYSVQPEVTMQEFTAEQCINLAVGATVTLKDARDDNVYNVTKLPDNNCWMTTNLMLGNTIVNSGSITINSSNSDYGGAAFTISSANVMAEGKTNNWTANDYDVLHIYARQASETDVNGNPYGNLYNFYTATTKSGTQSLATGNAQYSLCPKGWKLPGNTGNGSYTNLFQVPTNEGGTGITSITGTDITTFGKSPAITAEVPYSFPVAGEWVSGALSGVESFTYYWTREIINSNSAYRFGYGSEGVYYLQIQTSKPVGRSVRCVFAPAMQDFTTTACNNLTLAKSMVLTDNRDGNTYSVTKLADKNCWMTTNLMLGNTIINSGSINISSDNSDYSGTAFNIGSGSVMASGKTNNWTNNDYDVLHIYARQPSETDSNGNPYGNLYNFYSAIARSGTQSLTSGDASYSLCPKGWRLPSISGNPSYVYLLMTSAGMVNSAAGSGNTGFRDAIQKSPYDFSLAGSWVAGALYSVGVDGVYWTRSVYGDSLASYFVFRSSGDYGLQDRHYRYYGYSMRCAYGG